MDKKKKFSDSFKELLQMVPLVNRNQLYIGLKSKLERSMEEYVTERTNSTVMEIKTEHEKEQTIKDDRILYLESLLDQAGIKHKITCADVYPVNSSRD